MQFDVKPELNSTAGLMRIRGFRVLDRCTSFDIALGCVLSYLDLARQESRKSATGMYLNESR